MVVLLPHPTPRTDVGRTQQIEQDLSRGRAGRGPGSRIDRLVDLVRRPFLRHHVGGRLGQRLGGHVAHHLARVEHPQASRAGDFAHDGAIHIPADAHAARTASICSGATTASMRSWLSLIMISHDAMPGSRSGTRSVWMSMPTPPLCAISAADEVMPAAPRSCRATNRPACSSFQAHLQQFLLSERVAHLHRGTLLLQGLVELLAGEHAGAADAVPPGLRAQQHDVVPRARSLGCPRCGRAAPDPRSWRSPGSCRSRHRRSRPRRPRWGCPCSCRSRRCRPPRARRDSAGGRGRPGCRRRRRPGGQATRRHPRPAWPFHAGSSEISPKRRESRLQMGRDPMVKMSRTMPPTPVAAPW